MSAKTEIKLKLWLSDCIANGGYIEDAADDCVLEGATPEQVNQWLAELGREPVFAEEK